MIVDCHVHVWRYPDHFNKDAMLVNQPERRRSWSDEKFKLMWDNPIEGYLEVMDGVVDKAVIVGMRSWQTVGIDTPNEYLAKVAHQHSDKLAWGCCVIPTQEGATEEIEHCVKDLGAVAVGEMSPGYGEYYANDRKCYPTYETCQALGVPIIIHAGPSRPHRSRLKHEDVLAIDDIAIDFPDLKIVICHMGYYKYEDASFIVQKHENVFADISWLCSVSGFERSVVPRYLPVVSYPYFHYAYPLLYHLAQTFGATDKLLWGTDWKASPPKESIRVLTGINGYLKGLGLPEIPQATIDRILHENWKQVFTKL